MRALRFSSHWSVLLKSRVLELQRSAVLCHRPDHVIRCTRWDFSFDLYGDGHLGIEQPGKVLDHRACDHVDVAREAAGIDLGRTVEAAQHRRLRFPAPDSGTFISFSSRPRATAACRAGPGTCARACPRGRWWRRVLLDLRGGDVWL